MPIKERPFPLARDFDLSQSKRVNQDFNLNNEIPLAFRNLVDFLNQQPGWVMDVGKTRVALYENLEDDPRLGTAVQLSWFGEEQRVSLDLIPRRTETLEFARRNLGEQVPGQTHMYRVDSVNFFEDPRSVLLESKNNSSTGLKILKVMLDLDSGSVVKADKYTPKVVNKES